VNGISFQEALDRAKEVTSQNQPTLLLGNGFGMAYDPNIFSYQALFNSVDWSSTKRIQQVFAHLKTWDFELAIRQLDIAANVADIYGLIDSATGTKASGVLRHDACFLKNVLIRAVEQKHPAHIFEVPANRLLRTAKFLRNFGQLFTLNYDLLLYWTLVQPASGLTGYFRDGFRTVEGALEWTAFPKLGVMYLHGALHLFQQNGRLEKIKYHQAEGGRLIQQIRDRIANGHAPLFVCEGSNQQKLTHIESSVYLRHCFRSFESSTGVLFIYGLSLGDPDQHILDAISRSSIKHIFISLYGAPNSPGNQAIQQKAQALAHANSYRNLSVDFYDASSAELW
jgi:hypothetical protein